MATEFYVSIQGQKQGKFRGEDTQGGSQSKIAGLAFSYAASQPTVAGAGMASGRLQQDPVTIVKEWGAASPQIFDALINGEALTSVLFEFVKVDQRGQESVYHTIKLTNARVSRVSLHSDAPTPGTPGDTRELEEVSFSFQQMELTNNWGHTTTELNWGSKGAYAGGGAAAGGAAAGGAPGGAAAGGAAAGGAAAGGAAAGGAAAGGAGDSSSKFSRVVAGGAAGGAAAGGGAAVGDAADTSWKYSRVVAGSVMMSPAEERIRIESI